LTPDLDAQLSAAQAKLNSAKAVVKVREARQSQRGAHPDKRTGVPRAGHGSRRYRAGRQDHQAGRQDRAQADHNWAHSGHEVEVLTRLALSERIVNSPPDSLATVRITTFLAAFIAQHYGCDRNPSTSPSSTRQSLD
jgi:hypothetical protein